LATNSKKKAIASGLNCPRLVSCLPFRELSDFLVIAVVRPAHVDIDQHHAETITNAPSKMPKLSPGTTNDPMSALLNAISKIKKPKMNIIALVSNSATRQR